MDAKRKSGGSLTGALLSRSAKLKPFPHSYSLLSTTATETPGTWVEAMNFETARSMRVRLGP